MKKEQQYDIVSKIIEKIEKIKWKSIFSESIDYKGTIGNAIIDLRKRDGVSIICYPNQTSVGVLLGDIDNDTSLSLYRKAEETCTNQKDDEIYQSIIDDLSKS